VGGGRGEGAAAAGGLTAAATAGIGLSAAAVAAAALLALALLRRQHRTALRFELEGKGDPPRQAPSAWHDNPLLQQQRQQRSEPVGRHRQERALA
jgi:hypothetical protein